MNLKDITKNILKLLCCFSVVVTSLLCPLSVHYTEAEEIPVIDWDNIDDVAEVVSVYLPIVVSQSNTSLTKYSPWKNNIRSALNTLIATGYITLASAATYLQPLVQQYGGAVITFGSGAYNFLKTVWKTISDSNNIFDNSSGSITDPDSSGSNIEGITQFYPSYWTDSAFTTGSNLAFVFRGGSSLYVSNPALSRIYFNVGSETLAKATDYRFPINVYYGELEPNERMSISTSNVSGSDYAVYVQKFDKNSSGVNTNFDKKLTYLQQTSDNRIYFSSSPSNYPTDSYYIVNASNGPYTIGGGTYGSYFAVTVSCKMYFDKPDYIKKNSSTSYQWNFLNNYTGNLDLYDSASDSNKTVSLSGATNFPVRFYNNDFLSYPAVMFNGVDAGDGAPDTADYSTGSPEASIYDNPIYENRITVNGYTGSGYEELKQLIMDMYNSNTGIDPDDFSRQLYDVSTDTLVNVQDINATSNGILELLQPNDYSSSSVQDQTSSKTEFDNASDQLFQTESQLVDTYNNSLDNLTLSNPLNWGSDFLRASNWVKDQYDRMTINTPIGSLLGFSLTLGIVLLIVGKFLR